MTKRTISLLEHESPDPPQTEHAEEECLLNDSPGPVKAKAGQRILVQTAAVAIGIGALFLIANPGLLGAPASFLARTESLRQVQQRWSLQEFKVSASDTLAATGSEAKGAAKTGKEVMLAAYEKLKKSQDASVNTMVATLQEGAELCLSTAEELDTVLSAAEFFAAFVPGGQLLGVARESAENACGAMLAVTTAVVGEEEEDEEAIKEIKALRDHIDQRFDALSDQLSSFEQKFTQELFRKWDQKMNEIQYKYKSFVQSPAHYEDWSKLIEYKAQFDHYQFSSFFDLVYESAEKDPKNLNKWTVYLSRFLATRTKIFALLSDNPMFKSIGETESADYKKDMKLMKAYIRDKTEVDTSRTYKTLQDLPPLATDLDLSSIQGLMGNVKDLPKFLVRLILPNGAGIKGSLKDLPAPLVVFELGKSSGLKGDFKDLRPEMLHVGIGSATAISGDIKDLPRGLLYLDAAAASEVKGELKDLPPKVRYVNLKSASEVSGDLTDLPKHITAVDLASAEDVVGAFKTLPAGLEYLDCSACELTGDLKELPRSLTYLAETGKSTTGALTDLPPHLMWIDLKGYNRVSGSFKDLPKGTTHFGLDAQFGSQPLKGEFKDLPTNLQSIDVDQQKLCGDWKDAPKSFDAAGVARLTDCQKNLPDQKVTVAQMAILAIVALLFAGCVCYCFCLS